MILRQYLHTDPVIAASYLFGRGGQAAGAVVDPVGEPERYFEAAAAADHLSERLHALSDYLEVLPGTNVLPVEA